MTIDVKPGMTIREFLLAEAEGGAAAKIRTAPPADLLESIATERRAYSKQLDEIGKQAAEAFTRMNTMASLSDEFRSLLDEPMYRPPVLPVARSAHNQNREMPHPRPPAAPAPAPSASAPAVARPEPVAAPAEAVSTGERESAEARQGRRLLELRSMGADCVPHGAGWRVTGRRGALAALVRREAGQPMGTKDGVRQDLRAAVQREMARNGRLSR